METDSQNYSPLKSLIRPYQEESLRSGLERVLGSQKRLKIIGALLGLGFLISLVVLGNFLVPKTRKADQRRVSPLPFPAHFAVPSPRPTGTPGPTLEVRQTPTPRATATPKPSPSPSVPIDTSQTYDVPVMVLKYFPLKNGELDSQTTGLTEDLETVKVRVGRVDAQLITALGQGSAYHGYKDSQAKSSLRYAIVEEKEFLTAMPLSDNEVPWNPGIYRPDYYQILDEIDICDYVEEKGVKEVWVWGYHYGDLEPCESNMAGPNGDVSNSERIDDMPKCDQTYTLYNYNYGRGLSEALEDHTHQIEAVLNYVDRTLFWGKFVEQYSSPSGVNHCGWTHYPPNGEGDYDWYNEKDVWSDCEDWKPDGSGARRLVDCHTWAGEVCTDDGGVAFKIWWAQNIPGRNNDLTVEGKKLKNWWDFIGDFDQAMFVGRSLVYGESRRPVDL